VSLKRQAVRGQILRAAADLFRERGYRATTLDDIAAHLGMSKASLYGYFAAKEGILAAISRETMEMFSRGLAEISRRPLPPREKLRQVVHHHVELVLTHRSFLTVFFSEEASFPGPFARQMVREKDRYDRGVERIIREKYGDVGLKVYTLIDGRRTAEQIMKETGLTEAKLVEILDFMDEQGIIKLEYPKEKKTEETALPATMEKEEFAPMVGDEGEEELLKATLDMPIKTSLDFVKAMQLKTSIMLKHGDKGGRLFDQMDGKKDAIDLALAVNIPLYTVDTVLRFFLQQHAIALKPLTREEVKKKYGDDGYAVYKRYGKEGLMLYELIGKEMTIRQMADMVSTDKEKVVEMFLFIHKVLGIDLPIDKEVLYKQLGIG
jgi:AcrR family transcriptional regulator